jgi:O-antigen/teichoic acid export membrane protein
VYKKIVTQTTLYGISNTLSKLSGLILLPLFTNLLPVDEFGLLGLFETLSIFIIALSGMGLRAALPRWYWLPEKSAQQKELFFSVVVAGVVFAVLISVGCYFAASSFSSIIFRTEISNPVLLMFMASLFFKILNELPLLILRINQKAMAQTGYQTVNLVITVALTYYFLVVEKKGIIGIFEGQAIAALITNIISIPLVIKYINPRFLKSDFKAMIIFGFPLAMSNVLSILLSLSDRFILNYFINLEEVGTFSLASKIANVLQLIVITSFLSAYTHIFYQGMNRQGNQRLFSKAPTWFWLLTIVSALVLTLFGKEIVELTSFSNPEYWSSIDVLPLLVAGLLLGSVRQIFVLDLSYHHQTRAISISIIASGVINILLNLAMIPYWSSNGAALATAVTQLMVSVFLYQKIKRVSLIKYETRKMAMTFILASVITLIAVYCNQLNLGFRLLIKSVLIVSFFGTLWLSGYFDAKEIEILKGFWAKWKNPTKLVSNVKQFTKKQ